jgi:hypothetical protein
VSWGLSTQSREDEALQRAREEREFQRQLDELRRQVDEWCKIFGCSSSIPPIPPPLLRIPAAGSEVLEIEKSCFMVKSGIIIGLGGLVGWLLTNAVMLINFVRRMPRGEFMVREFLAVFLTGGMGKDYMDLLRESHIESSWFDKVLCILDRTFACSFIGSIVLVVIGFIWR